MPRAEILSTQAMHTLRQLHAELSCKLQVNKSDGDRLRDSMQPASGKLCRLARKNCSKYLETWNQLPT
jgi:hypothetical protein